MDQLGDVVDDDDDAAAEVDQWRHNHIMEEIQNGMTFSGLSDLARVWKLTKTKLRYYFSKLINHIFGRSSVFDIEFPTASRLLDWDAKYSHYNSNHDEELYSFGECMSTFAAMALSYFIMQELTEGLIAVWWNNVTDRRSTPTADWRLTNNELGLTPVASLPVAFAISATSADFFEGGYRNFHDFTWAFENYELTFETDDYTPDSNTHIRLITKRLKWILDFEPIGTGEASNVNIEITCHDCELLGTLTGTIHCVMIDSHAKFRLSLQPTNMNGPIVFNELIKRTGGIDLFSKSISALRQKIETLSPSHDFVMQVMSIADALNSYRENANRRRLTKRNVNSIMNNLELFMALSNEKYVDVVAKAALLLFSTRPSEKYQQPDNEWSHPWSIKLLNDNGNNIITKASDIIFDWEHSME